MRSFSWIPLVLTLAGAMALGWPHGRAAKSIGLRFSDVTESAGLSAPLRGIMGHAAAWGDADGDGRIDLFVGTFCDRPPEAYVGAPGPVPNRFFFNRGTRFERSEQPILEMKGRASGALFADLDNDGDLDLYVGNNTVPVRGFDPARRAASELPSALFENTGRGIFRDVSAQSGLCPPTGLLARSIGALDYNADGLLDLFVADDQFRNPNQARSRLFRNQGGLRFEEANDSAGLPNDIRGWGVAIADLNGDRRPDLFVSQANRLFLSKGDGTYREATELNSVLAWRRTRSDAASCGAAFGDLDNDGDFDLVVTEHFSPASNRVYLNEGMKDGRLVLRNVTEEAGLAEPVPTKTPHVEIADLDNDGRMDIYTPAIFLEDGKVEPLVFHNEGVRNGIPHFSHRPYSSRMRYFAAGPTGDYDNDGDLDLIGISFEPDLPSRLLRNDSARRHWLQVQVIGKRMNRMGIGAQVRLYRPGRTGQAGALLGLQEVSTGYGFSSSQPAICHFGLGSQTECDVEVRFPITGRVKRLTHVRADQRLKVEEE